MLTFHRALLLCAALSLACTSEANAPAADDGAADTFASDLLADGADVSVDSIDDALADAVADASGDAFSGDETADTSGDSVGDAPNHDVPGDTTETSTLILYNGESVGFAASTFTAGQTVYASATAGGVTQTKPTVSAGGSQKAIILLGYADTDTSLVLRPGPVSFLKRASLANNATLTIEHYADPDGHTRVVSAYKNSSPAEPCVVGRFSAGTRDVGVRFDDGSGANADTKTTFKNTSGATLDVTCLVNLP